MSGSDWVVSPEPARNGGEYIHVADRIGVVISVFKHHRSDKPTIVEYVRETLNLKTLATAMGKLYEHMGANDAE